MLSEDRFYEILTAALSREQIPSAQVDWNVKLNGRQFDVLAKIPAGPHTLVIAYEVKKHGRRVEVKDIEAFITKAKDVLASKLVFVSSNGFQSGCLDVGRRHGLDMFELSLNPPDETVLPDGAYVLNGQIVGPPIFQILPKEAGNEFEAVTLIYEDGSRVSVPDETTQMHYCLERALVGGRSLLEIIDPEGVETLQLDEHKRLEVIVNGDLVPPDPYFLKPGFVRALEVDVRGVEYPLIVGDVPFETTLISPDVRYRNVITEEIIEAKLTDLPFGPLLFEAGKFYFSYNPLRYIYCQDVQDGTATIYVIESFQRGVLARGVFEYDADCSRFYIELPKSDRKLRQRMDGRLADLREMIGRSGGAQTASTK